MNAVLAAMAVPGSAGQAGSRLPLTAAQLGIWIGQQLDPASPAYWTAEAIHLHGPLQRAALMAAIRTVLGEAASLHGRFEHDGTQVWQTICAQPWSVTEADFSHDPDALASAGNWMQQDLLQRPDLQGGPLFATALLRLSPTHHLWYLRAHHIALDGYGHALLATRLAARYAANCQPIMPGGNAISASTCGNYPAPAPAQTLAALVEEDSAYQNSAARKRDQTFWLARLDQAAPPTLLAAPALLAHTVRREQASVAASEMARWQALASRHALDRGTLLQAALLAWLARISGQPVLRCGVPQMLRLGSCAVDLPCMAMNILPLVMPVDHGQTLLQLATSLGAELAAMRRHQRYRHEHLKREVAASAATGATGASGAMHALSRERRLFGVVINWMPFERPARFGHLQAQSHSVASGPVEDLAIKLEPQHDGSLHLTFDANPAAYAGSRLLSLLAGLQATLSQCLTQPDIPLQALAPVSAATCMAILNGPALPGPAVDVLQALQAQAQMRPDHPAVQQDGMAISYGQLLAQVHSLAGQLQSHGAGPGQLVACLLPRSPQAIIAILATLAAGAAFLPLDPAGPPARTASVLAQARPVLGIARQADAASLALHCRILTLQQAADGSHVLQSAASADQPHRPGASDGYPATARLAPAALIPATGRADTAHGIGSPHCVHAPDHPSAPDALAYVIYTSGSTGQPNGVMIGRCALAHFVAAIGQLYRPGPHDRVLQFAPLHFDACIEEIFGALCHGATLVLRNDSMLDSLPGFMQACAKLGITLLDLPTAFWHELAVCISAGLASLPDSVQQVIIGGEAALPGHLARWRASVAPHVVLHNTYGPTEATVICSSARLAGPPRIGHEAAGTDHAMPGSDPSAPLPIGRPLPGVMLAVLDDDGHPCPPGSAGQLHIAGPTLALGYLDQPQISAQRFRPRPGLPQAGRWYQSGDRVVLGPDGELRYLGRMDDEIKMSGHRIDPLEIETTLQQYPGVAEAALLAWQADTDSGLAIRQPVPENGLAIRQPAPGGGLEHAAPWHLVAFLVLETTMSAGATPLESGLREFLARRLPAPALPARYVFLPRLPRNRNGKIDRSGLRHQAQQGQHAQSAQNTGDNAAPATPAAATPLEQRIMAVWSEILGVVTTPQDDFFLLGGKSLQAIQCANRMSLSLQREVAVSTLFRHPRLAQLAHMLETTRPSPDSPGSPGSIGAPPAANQAMPGFTRVNADGNNHPNAYATLHANSGAGSRTDFHADGSLAGNATTTAKPCAGAEFAPLLGISPGTGPTLFCLHPAEGLSWCYLGLSAHLPHMPMAGLQARGMLGELPGDIHAMLDDYLALIRQTQPHGPYYLLGWSSGGGIAHALATRLQALGQEVALLALMDAYPSDIWHGKPPPALRDALVALLDVVGASEFDASGKALPAPALLQSLLAPGSTLAHVGEAQLQRIAHCALHTMQIYRDLQHQVFTGDMLFFHALQRQPDAPDWRGWQPYVRGRIERIDIDSNHNGMSLPAPLAHIGRVLANKLHHLAGQFRP